MLKREFKMKNGRYHMNKQNTNETRFITKKGNKITDLLT